MEWLVLVAVVAAVGVGVYLAVTRKATSVADITKPLSNIVNKLHEHADDQHDEANRHDANIKESAKAAIEARRQRDHARHVAERVGQLVTTPAPTAG